MLWLLCTALFPIYLSITCAQNYDALDGQMEGIFGGSDGLDADEPIAYHPPEVYVKCAFNQHCVERLQCVNGTIIDDGRFIIDIRINDGGCGYMQVCCSANDELENPITAVPPALPAPQPAINERYNGCGYANHDGIGFATRGAMNGESQFAEFPWMVAILLHSDKNGQIDLSYQCGGALIASNVIVTAAHCVRNHGVGNLVVRAGEWDSQHTNEPIKHVDTFVNELIIHEMFNRTTYYNDMALLITKNAFVFQPNIKPICLPDDQINFNYTTCYATGWGKNKFGRYGVYQDILKKIRLPIVPHDKCQSNLRKTALGRRFELHDSFICAGGERDMDMCQGDGGSPLVCPVPNGENRYYMVGIVSWGKGCGRANVPGVYSSIPHLREWINSKLLHKNVDFSHFTVPPYSL